MIIPDIESGSAGRLPLRRPPLVALAATLTLWGCTRHTLPATTPAEPLLNVTLQQSGTTALLQAVSIVDSLVVWVAGHNATYVRTTDGGATWHAAVVPNADSLEFRDVYAVDARTAYLLSAGPGERSRIYKTTDGGRTWSLQFTNRDPSAFFDCLDFWDSNHGIAVSDAVDGRFLVILTADGGVTWTPVPADALPAALPSEGAFAASGTCVIARAPGEAWIGTGNAGLARVLHTADRGRTWELFETPLPSGSATGIASLAFRDAAHGVAMGGPVADRRARGDEVALTGDGGRSWILGGRPPFPGAIYGGTYVPGSRPPILVAVGPGGAAASVDDGRTWVTVDTLSYWSVGFATPSAGWAVGPGGRIARLSVAPSLRTVKRP
jgi:photosystem II stability/assembly factor-like uncharacterized protein